MHREHESPDQLEFNERRSAVLQSVFAGFDSHITEGFVTIYLETLDSISFMNESISQKFTRDGRAIPRVNENTLDLLIPVNFRISSFIRWANFLLKDLNGRERSQIVQRIARTCVMYINTLLWNYYSTLERYKHVMASRKPNFINSLERDYDGFRDELLRLRSGFGRLMVDA